MNIHAPCGPTIGKYKYLSIYIYIYIEIIFGPQREKNILKLKNIHTLTKLFYTVRIRQPRALEELY